MSQENKISVKLKNINVNLFTNLINQSLLVSQQLMFEFTPEVLKSVNLSSSNTLMKIWVIGIDKLIKTKKDELEEIESLGTIPGLEEPEENINLGFDKTFNMYLLKGEQFKNVLKIFKNDTIDIEFFLMENDEGYQATSLIIKGFSENDRPLTTEFLLTVESLISNKVSDYNEILDHCKPKPDMTEISLTDGNIKELRTLIATLHKTMPNNSSYVTFKVTEDKVTINDKVFNITFDDIKITNLPLGEELEFNMLKADFGLIGNLSFKIYTSAKDNAIHIGSSFNSSILYCLTAKVYSTEDALDSDSDDILTADDLSMYNLED